jgi:hypothetical protein
MSDEEETVVLGDTSVCIGIPISGGMPPRSVMSLVKTVELMMRMGIRFDIVMEAGGSVQWARDGVLDQFLKGDKDKLFWIDSDIVWAPESFIRLLALSTKVDVVTAAYPAKVESATTTFYANFIPGVKNDGPCGLMEVHGLGLGFAVVDRKVMEVLAANAPRVKEQISGREMASVFRMDIVDGNRRGEDIAFFADVRDLGHKVWLDPHTSLGHIGNHEWKGSVLEALTKVKPELVEAAA